MWLSIRINVGLALVSVTLCGFAVTLRFGQGEMVGELIEAVETSKGHPAKKDFCRFFLISPLITRFGLLFLALKQAFIIRYYHR